MRKQSLIFFHLNALDLSAYNSTFNSVLLHRDPSVKLFSQVEEKEDINYTNEDSK